MSIIDNLSNVNPEFVDMCIRSVYGEQSIHDVLAKTDGAAMAHALRLEKIMMERGKFVHAVGNSQLFNVALQDCLTKVSGVADPNQKRAIFAAFIAQAMLIGIHMAEQLIDKQKKGLIK